MVVSNAPIKMPEVGALDRNYSDEESLTLEEDLGVEEHMKLIKENAQKATALMTEGAFADFSDYCKSFGTIETPMLWMGGVLSLMSMWNANMFSVAQTRGNLFVANLSVPE